MNSLPKAAKNSKGFTILELMIATTVFSLVLLVVSFSIIKIGRMYYKNITASRTQEITRTISEDLSRSMQFGGGRLIHSTPDPPDPSGNKGAYCIGTDRYSYQKNSRVNGGAHALWRDKIVEGACEYADFSSASDPRELLNQNMRLMVFSIDEKPGNLIDIKIKVASGEDDLLDLAVPPEETQCLSGRGSDFCAVSKLDTTVKKRIK